MSKAACWAFLAVSTLLGVASLGLFKSVQAERPFLGFLIIVMALILIYYCRAKAVLRIPVAVTYAVYEAGGLVLAALTGYICLSEPLGSARVAGIAMLLAGAWLIHHGTEAGKKDH